VDSAGTNLLVVDNSTSTLCFYTCDPGKEVGDDLHMRGSLDLSQVGTRSSRRSGPASRPLLDGGLAMKALRCYVAAAWAAALLLLALSAAADAQVRISRGFDPWTGRPYRTVAGYNPWTGRVVQGRSRTNPWTGTTVRTARAYNPWTGRTVYRRVEHNPWTGQTHWSVSGGRRGW
jgi:hypothetical protein